MLIAGDIGGTKTNLALFELNDEGYSYSHLMQFHSQNYPNLRSIVLEFIEGCKKVVGKVEVHFACFAIAGPVDSGVCRATNLPWVVDTKELEKATGIDTVYLINDLEANAYALDILQGDELLRLCPGKGEVAGHRAVVSPGTGLGEAGLFWDGKEHHPFACEGGHCEFGPRDELQIDLCRFLYQRFGHASYERVLSGPGIYNLYQFFRDVQKRDEPQWLTDELKEDDPAKVITVNAVNKKSELCVDTMHLFCSILGAEASNCVLKYMARGGVFLGGGIPPKTLPLLQGHAFMEGFLDKGRFRQLMEEVPIWVIMDDKASLKGAARYGRKGAENAKESLK